MTQEEREQAARAIFKVYKETEAKLSKIASKAREHVRKIDEAIEDDEKNFDIEAAVSVYQELEKIEGAQRVASKMNCLRNRARKDGTREDFEFMAVRLVLIGVHAKGPLEIIEELMHSFD